MSRLAKNIGELFVIGGIAAGIIVPTALVAHSYFGKETVRTRIIDAQMVKVDGRYMIATEAEPFENHDAKYRGKWNSGSVQNQAIKLTGQEVELEVYGWRLPFFSAYRNVRTIVQIQTPIKSGGNTQ